MPPGMLRLWCILIGIKAKQGDIAKRMRRLNMATGIRLLVKHLQKHIAPVVIAQHECHRNGTIRK